MLSTIRISRQRTGGGFQHRYATVVEHLVSRGHEVHVVYLDDGSLSPSFEAADLQVALSCTISVQPYPDSIEGKARRYSQLLLCKATRPSDQILERVLDGLQPDLVVQLLGFDPSLGGRTALYWPTVLVAEEDFSKGWDSATWGPLSRSRLRDTALTCLEHRLWITPRVVTIISERERRWANQVFPSAMLFCVSAFLEPDYWEAGIAMATDTIDVFAIGEFDQLRNAVGLEAFLHVAASARVPFSVAVASRRGLHPSLSAMAGGDVQFLGFVEDPRPYYRSAWACIVPSFHVSGAKNQVLQGWATKCPVVATSPAAKSVGGRHRVDLLTGNSAEELVDQLMALRKDESLREAVRRGGSLALSRDHSAGVAMKQFDAAIDAAVGYST